MIGLAVEIAVAYLALLSAAMAVIDFLSYSGELRAQIYALDLIIVIILSLDLLWRAVRSGEPVRYVASHIYELPALLPLYLLAMVESSATLLGLLRLLRLYRLVVLVAMLWRGSEIVRALSVAARRTQFLTVITALLLTVLSSAALVYFLEAPRHDSNIKSFWDALWWAFATVTTVGYGDYYPVSPGGKVIGVLTMLVGIAFFSAFAGLVAATLAELSKQER